MCQCNTGVTVAENGPLHVYSIKNHKRFTIMIQLIINLQHLWFVIVYN